MFSKMTETDKVDKCGPDSIHRQSRQWRLEINIECEKMRHKVVRWRQKKTLNLSTAFGIIIIIICLGLGHFAKRTQHSSLLLLMRSVRRFRFHATHTHTQRTADTMQKAFDGLCEP